PTTQGISPRRHVAPHAGAWIETPTTQGISPRRQSLPMRERGLKPTLIRLARRYLRRSPCGSVD
ncbi:MAG: hypothetical protein SOZ94_01345, partial [Prevotella sp.]|nr:hypothetical protein [Prevotella sp.]